MPDTITFDSDRLRFNPPVFPEKVLREILSDRYGLTGSLKHLAGERDQNTLVISDSSEHFVLKISGPDEALETVDFQIQALLHLQTVDPELSVPRQIPDRFGRQASVLHDRSGQTHWVRLVSFLKGEPVDNYDQLNTNTIQSIGQVAGRLCAALKDFDHSAAMHFMPWDPLNGIIFSRELRDSYLPEVIRPLAEQHLERLEADSVLRIKALPSQVIHHDAHPGNIICEPGHPARITGVIDFGDLLRRPVIMDLSVALSNALRHNGSILEATSAMLQGYTEYVPLSEAMLELLYDALCASYILSVQLLNFRAQHHRNDPEKLRQEDAAGGVSAAQRFLRFDRERFSEHVLKYQAS